MPIPWKSWQELIDSCENITAEKKVELAALLASLKLPIEHCVNLDFTFLLQIGITEPLHRLEIMGKVFQYFLFEAQTVKLSRPLAQVNDLRRQHQRAMMREELRAMLKEDAEKK